MYILYFRKYVLSIIVIASVFVLDLVENLIKRFLGFTRAEVIKNMLKRNYIFGDSLRIVILG